MSLPRNLQDLLIEEAETTPVMLLTGARQTGKSTLMKGLFAHEPDTEYKNLDDWTTLNVAQNAPKSFIESLPRRAIIDEIQKLPQLLLPIKESVDINRQPGRFFLTGSANILSLPKVSDSLAGRMHIQTLWPFSQGEIKGVKETFIDSLFTDAPLKKIQSIKFPELLEAITIGGYPELLNRESERSRRLWFESYITALLQKDVRDLSHIEGLSAMPNLLSLIATRVSGMANLSDLARSFQLSHMSIRRYLALIESLFLVVSLPPWYYNLGKRLVKSAKYYINDTGLLCYLLGANAKMLANNRTLFGQVLENFVVMELIKQISWSEIRPRLYHYRTHGGQEIDMVLEANDGRLVAIECKSASSLTADSFKQIKLFREQAKDRYHKGIILYTGSETLSFGDREQAVPISALWEVHAAKTNKKKIKVR